MEGHFGWQKQWLVHAIHARNDVALPLPLFLSLGLNNHTSVTLSACLLALGYWTGFSWIIWRGDWETGHSKYRWQFNIRGKPQTIPCISLAVQGRDFVPQIGCRNGSISRIVSPPPQVRKVLEQGLESLWGSPEWCDSTWGNAYTSGFYHDIFLKLSFYKFRHRMVPTHIPDSPKTLDTSVWYLYFLLHEVQRTIPIWFTSHSLTSPNRWALKSNLGAGTTIQFWVTRLPTTTKIICTAPYCHLNLFWKLSGGQVIFFLIMAPIYQCWWFFQRRRGALPSPSCVRLI